jgi:serine/threonine protein kinase
MAVKQIAIDEVSTKELSSLENEINLLRSFRHPNIVRYIGTEVTPIALSIFLEYVPGGSLKALIDKFGQLEESVAKSYTRQVRNEHKEFLECSIRLSLAEDHLRCLPFITSLLFYTLFY